MPKKGVFATLFDALARSLVKYKKKHGISYACMVACLIILIIAVVVAFVASIIAFVLIANLHSDIDLVMMESVNNSGPTMPFINSLSSLRTNITAVESKIPIFYTEMEQRFHTLKSNISMRNKKLENQTNNMTNFQVRAHQIQTELEMRISEFGSNVSVRLVEYSLNMTNVLDTSMKLASRNISQARDTSGRSVDKLTTQIVQDVPELHVFESCDAISMLSPPFSSGEYLIQASSGALRTYCTIFSCNGINGGWRRIAYFNTSDPSTNQCPGDLELITPLLQRDNTRFCRRNVSNPGCSSVVYKNDGIPYIHVCGMINAYQVGTPDGFHNKLNKTIEGTYVDGVSLTYGMNPRNHIWTFVAQAAGSCINCGDQSPNFIGSHYSCEIDQCGINRDCSNNVLWDGDQCIGGAWFERNLDLPTMDDIEIRVCRSQNQGDEDIRLSIVDLYIQQKSF